MPMPSRLALATSLLVSAFLVAGCSQPTDIVLGNKPIETISANSEQIRKLPEEDRELLMRFLLAREVLAVLPGAQGDSSAASVGLAGRTVGEALELARAWEKENKARQAAREEAERQAEALRQKVLADQQKVQQEISAAVTVALVKKQVLPADAMNGRYTDMLKIIFAVENKSPSAIKLLKGKAVFKDLAGDPLGELSVEFDEGFAPGKMVTTSGGVVWRLNEFLSGEIEQIARTNPENLRFTFLPEALVFEDGKVLKIPASAN